MRLWKWALIDFELVVEEVEVGEWVSHKALTLEPEEHIPCETAVMNPLWSIIFWSLLVVVTIDSSGSFSVLFHLTYPCLAQGQYTLSVLWKSKWKFKILSDLNFLCNIYTHWNSFLWIFQPQCIVKKVKSTSGDVRDKFILLRHFTSHLRGFFSSNMTRVVKETWLDDYHHSETTKAMPHPVMWPIPSPKGRCEWRVEEPGMGSQLHCTVCVCSMTVVHSGHRRP